MRRRLPLLAGVALVVGLLAPSVTSANHSWGGYHWARTANPFTLLLGDNVSGAWDSVLLTSAADWSSSSVLDTARTSGGSARPKNCRPTAGRDEICNASYGNNGWLGIAQIWISGLHITQGTVRVNDFYMNSAPYNTTAWRNLVMCQEVGHTLGLDHQDETNTNANLGTCMDYTNDPDGGAGGAVNNDPSNEHPNSHDYAQLVTIYSHNDSSSTVGAASTKGAPVGALASEAAEWGLEVARTNGGRTSIFVLDLGAGQSLVSFVIWA